MPPPRWPALPAAPLLTALCTMQACIFEYYQKLTGVPTFETERHAGGSPDLPFLCTLTCPAVQTPKGGYEECVFTAQGRSKKAAEHAASEKALEFIRGKGLLPEPVVDAAPTSTTALKEEARGRRPAMLRATGCLLGPSDRRPPPVVGRAGAGGCGGSRSIAASGPTLGRCQALAGRRPALWCPGAAHPAPPMTHPSGRTAGMQVSAATCHLTSARHYSRRQVPASARRAGAHGKRAAGCDGRHDCGRVAAAQQLHGYYHSRARQGRRATGQLLHPGT